MFTQRKDLDQLGEQELLSYFNSLFNQVAIRHGYHNAFENFMDCCINGFCFNYDKTVMEYIRKKYTQDERHIFGEMLRVWIMSMNKRITSDNMFYDFLGTFYEQQAMSKQKGFAQYFTPDTICIFMASIVSPSEEAQYVHEPTCGSGRMNLAMHAQNHRLFHVANDLDYTCAKMAALNFMVHGVKGIVTCDDGLFPKRSFKGAFVVNYRQAPYLEFIDDVDVAYGFIHLVVPSEKVNEQPVETSEQPITTETDQANSSPKPGEQLTLF